MAVVSKAVARDVQALLRRRQGIMLDVGAGENVQPGFVGMDIRPLPGIGIVHDLEEYPWPLPDGCCLSVLCSHVAEHISPARFGFVKFMDEIWRVLRPRGRLMLSGPYGVNDRYLQDPTHCNPLTERKFAYFAPEHESGLWRIYKPRPWRIIANAWCSTGDIEVVLEKLPLNWDGHQKNGRPHGK